LAPLRLLAYVAPNEECRKEVLESVEPFLAGEKGFLRNSAVAAYANWSTAENVPKLIDLIDESDLTLMIDLTRGLGKTKDPRAMEALARLMLTDTLRGSASSALRDGGPAAEAATIPLLKDSNDRVQREACRVLEKVGGPDSVAALQQFLKENPTSTSRTSVERALRTLEKK
jgi:HEAT repeat protein